ncbi:MAG: thiamine pyrophosphate-dependent enzyme [Methanolinea sp.]|nr:thiamine pyrophosphate-dependent enzyme [Methanolinea sp.]
MSGRNLITEAQNTWCPGCGNFTLQFSLKNVLTILEKDGISLDSVVLVTGIGCHAKMADYLNVNSFYSIHGRAIPAAAAIKMANPDLTVICCAGDGDAYAEGLDHLVFAAKRNSDITVIIHDNRVYGLTTGQYTPTSPLGFKGKSTPGGTREEPFNPMEIMLASGATFLARGYTRKMALLQESILEGIRHKGFAFIDVLQICASYFNRSDYYDRLVYELKDHDPLDFDAACRKVREWDYNREAPIALGTFFRTARDTLENQIRVHGTREKDRDSTIRRILLEKS